MRNHDRVVSATVRAHKYPDALRKAHEVLAKRLHCPNWGADDFYSAMAVYRQSSGIEFNSDDDASLDRWLDGAATVWEQELNRKGDSINLAEILEKAIAAGMKAIGL